eukprot:2511549-Rhodomonas_salina.1
MGGRTKHWCGAGQEGNRAGGTGVRENSEGRDRGGGGQGVQYATTRCAVWRCADTVCNTP